LIARIIDEVVIGLLMVPWLLVAAVVAGLGQIAYDSARYEVTVAATAIIGAGVAAGASYEVWTSLIAVGVGKWAAGVRVAAADRPTPLQVREALARWLLLVGPTPLAWLTLGAGGTGSDDHRSLVNRLLVVTLVWRTTVGLSVLAKSGAAAQVVRGPWQGRDRDATIHSLHWRMEKEAPSGSLRTATRPTLNRSKGSTETVAPNSAARAAVRSVSATAK
jgi:hypothetical protein